MRLTRQHFQLIASILNDADPTTYNLTTDSPQFDFYYQGKFHQHRDLVHNFADALARTNPNFDRERFIEACTPGLQARKKNR